MDTRSRDCTKRCAEAFRNPHGFERRVPEFTLPTRSEAKTSFTIFYAATTLSLAMLELLVPLPLCDVPTDLVRIRITLPGDVAVADRSCRTSRLERRRSYCEPQFRRHMVGGTTHLSAARSGHCRTARTQCFDQPAASVVWTRRRGCAACNGLGPPIVQPRDGQECRLRHIRGRCCERRVALRVGRFDHTSDPFVYRVRCRDRLRLFTDWRGVTGDDGGRCHDRNVRKVGRLPSDSPAVTRTGSLAEVSRHLRFPPALHVAACGERLQGA
jgi:hypothetical protein